MRLTPNALNALVDYVGSRLDGGKLQIYDGPPTGAFAEPLATLQLQDPAFKSAVNGRASAHPPEKTYAVRKGAASWAQLITRTGEMIGVLEVAASGTAEAKNADVLLSVMPDPERPPNIPIDPTDFSPGLAIGATTIVLRLAD